MALGDPFDFVGSGETAAIGVVCVHGFTSTPYEVRYLGEQIAAAGFAVHGLRLPGHGTDLDDLDRATWQDWADAVEDAFDTMRRTCDRVTVVGQSLGGLLALHLAARRPEVVSVASLAAPLWLTGAGRHVARWAAAGTLERVAPWLASIPKFSGSDVRDPAVRAENPCYDGIPLKALGQLVRYMEVVDAALPRITQPVLVLHATHDHTAPVACAFHIAHKVRAQRVRILPRSYHLIAADVERDIVADEVVAFVRRTTTATDMGDHACAT